MIPLINGFASTVLNTENDISYKIRIHSQDRSGINILSDSTKLNLIITSDHGMTDVSSDRLIIIDEIHNLRDDTVDKKTQQMIIEARERLARDRQAQDCASGIMTASSAPVSPKI